MDKKRKILKLAIFVFMVLSISLTTSQTLAYWVQPTSATDTATATVTTGEWQQAFPYDPTYSYAVGDQVTNNGVTYQAKKDGLLKEPGVDPGWKSEWDEVV